MILPPPSRNKHTKGFTLAEVLIALVIIGIISAITISSLIQSTQKQEFVSSLKKTYSVLSQATNRIIAEEGVPGGGSGWSDNTDNVYTLYKRYLNNAKECKIGMKGCSNHSIINLKGNKVDGDWFHNDGRNRLVLADGVQLEFGVGVNNLCSNHGGSRCYWIIVDLNGDKKPNVSGRDIFLFEGFNDGLFPQCGSNCNALSDSMNYSCACKVLIEGKMDY